MITDEEADLLHKEVVKYQNETGKVELTVDEVIEIMKKLNIEGVIPFKPSNI